MEKLPGGAKPHSALGASSAARWMACPASVRLSDGLESKSSVWADEGTNAHELAEYCLKNGEVDATPYVGMTIAGEVGRPVVTEEMARAVNVYLEHVAGVLAGGGDLYVEKQITLEKLIPEMPAHRRPFGTCDTIVYRPAERALYVADYKHGAGIPVAAEANAQIRYYALGALYAFDGFDVRTVHVSIVQPRAEIGGEAVRTEVLDAFDLMEWGVFDLKPAALATLDPNAPARPGKHCRFCKAAGKTCEAFERQAFDAATDEFGAIVPADDVPLRELGERLAKAEILEAWVKRIKEIAEAEAKAGRMPAGYKWVYGRGSREWRESETAIAHTVLELTGVGITDTVTLSVAQAEKRLGKKLFGRVESLVEKKPGKLQLAKESDPRPAANPAAEAISHFEEISP